MAFNLFCYEGDQYMDSGRSYNRAADETRTVTIIPKVLDNPAGACFTATGKTKVLYTANFEAGVPRWREG